MSGEQWCPRHNRFETPCLNPYEVILFCPMCKRQHIDEGEPHRTHECASCGHRWDAAKVGTLGGEEFMRLRA